MLREIFGCMEQREATEQGEEWNPKPYPLLALSHPPWWVHPHGEEGRSEGCFKMLRKPFPSGRQCPTGWS